MSRLPDYILVNSVVFFRSYDPLNFLSFKLVNNISRVFELGN